MAEQIEDAPTTTEGTNNEDEVKVGARHSAKDQEMVQNMHDYAVSLGAICDAAKEGKAHSADHSADHPTEPVMVFGGDVKAAEDGHFTGYLIRFTDETSPDLTGDFFTAETDFGSFEGKTVSVYFNHRLPLTTKDGTVIQLDDPIGEGRMMRDAKGILLDAIIHQRNEYERDIVKAGKRHLLGWSSGTASHLVDREQRKGARWIKRWPLGIDASLTPTPAEPRNDVLPIKTYAEGLDGLTLDNVTAEVANHNPMITTGEDNMSTEQKNAPPADATVSPDVFAKLQADVTEIKTRMASFPAIVAGHVTAVPEDERPFKTLASQLMAEVKRATTGIVDPRQEKLNRRYADELKATGMSEGTLADGGALVQTEFSNALLQRAYEQGAIMSRTAKQPIGPNYNAYSALLLDESSRADGSRSGGVQMYWLNEGGTYTASRPKFRRVELKLEKLIGLVYATDENLQDAAQLEGIIAREFPKEFDFKAEDAIINGTGAGMPLGILSSAATVSVAKETGQTAATVVFANIVKMWARMYAPSRANAAWLINQDIEPQLMQLSLPVGTGGLPAYMPANGLSERPFATLMGRPVIPVEYCATLGTVGDIILADLSQYLVVNKGGLDVASSIHVQFLTGEQAFRFTSRLNGAPLWHAALTPKNGTNTLSPFVTLATRA